MFGIDTVEVIGKSKDKSAGRDDDLVNAAIGFMKANADKPFYLNIWGHSTHFPVNPSEELAQKFNDVKVNRNDFSKTMQHKFDECLQIGGDLDESMRQYLGDVYSIDRNIDRILKTIDELGLRKNTIVIFSSDHGPAPVTLANKGARKYSKNMLGYAGVFCRGKHDQLEGGTRVPFIIRWPGHVKAGRVDRESMISFIDWMPTLTAIVGIDDLPKQLDGEDISDIWFGTSRRRMKPLFWKTSSADSNPAIREGKWKLHLKTGRDQQVELYDLSVDPSESRNVAGKYPEIVTEMKSRLENGIAELPGSYEKK